MNFPASHRITSPADLLALVPTVLGFHPEDSLVLVVTAGETGAMHARVDLPKDDEEAADAVGCLLAATSRSAARQVALVAYTDDEMLAEEVVDVLLEQLCLRAVEVVCAIRADGRRWYSLDWGSVPCPDEGTPYDLSSHPFTARAVLDGRVVFDSRRALADSLVAADPDAVEAVEQATERALRCFEPGADHPFGPGSEQGRRTHLMTEGSWVRDRVRRYLRTGEPLDHDEAGRLVAAILDIDVRDVAWAEISRADASTHVELWRDVVRRTPLDLLAAPAALLAFAAWLAGDGALAWCAVERSWESDPDYSMAALVAQALVAAMPPSTWQPIPPDDLPLFAG